MEQRYQILSTIYEIAMHDPEPQTYPCRLREIILRQLLDWGIIQQQLGLLEKEELVTTK